MALKCEHPPVRNLNGTSIGHLVLDAEMARGAVADALRAVYRIDFHGRDYVQPRGMEYYRAAHDERQAMLAALTDVLHYFDSYYSQVKDQDI